jgi:hypothetical protein
MPKPIQEDPLHPTPKFRDDAVFAGVRASSPKTPMPQIDSSLKKRVHKLDNLKDFVGLQNGLKTAKSAHIIGGTP